jgi:hypothetical protein
LPGISSAIRSIPHGRLFTTSPARAEIILHLGIEFLLRLPYPAALAAVPRTALSTLPSRAAISAVPPSAGTPAALARSARHRAARAAAGAAGSVAVEAALSAGVSSVVVAAWGEGAGSVGWVADPLGERPTGHHCCIEGVASGGGPGGHEGEADWLAWVSSVSTFRIEDHWVW